MSSRTLGYVFVVAREFPALCRAQMSGVRLSNDTSVHAVHLNLPRDRVLSRPLACWRYNVCGSLLDSG